MFMEYCAVPHTFVILIRACDYVWVQTPMTHSYALRHGHEREVNKMLLRFDVRLTLIKLYV
jgi:hypothetical protein